MRFRRHLSFQDSYEEILDKVYAHFDPAEFEALYRIVLDIRQKR